MHHDDTHARVGHRGSAISRVKLLALKTLAVLGGVTILASAFVVSLVFVAIGMAVVLTVGGYLWWQTREVRRQVRARMQGQSPPQSAGEVIEGEIIEGEVISHERTRR